MESTNKYLKRAVIDVEYFINSAMVEGNNGTLGNKNTEMDTRTETKK